MVAASIGSDLSNSTFPVHGTMNSPGIRPLVQLLWIPLSTTSKLDSLMNPVKGSDEKFFAKPSGPPNVVFMIDTSGSMDAWPRAWSNDKGCTFLDDLGYHNVALVTKDGTAGWNNYAPYDAILVAAAAPSVPDALVEQLSEKGRLLIPVGDRHHQRLTLVRKTEEGGVEQETVTGCVFVPLIGRFGWAE